MPASRSFHRFAFMLPAAVVLGAALLVGLAADASAAPSGSLLWSRITSGVVTAQGDDVLDSAKGPDGSVYLCGVYLWPAASGYVWAARYSSSGKLLWLRKYGEAQGIDANGEACVVDRFGNLFVAGEAVYGANMDMFLVKYSPSGARQWVQHYDGPAAGQDYAYDLAVDSDGSAYLGGTSTGVGTGLDLTVVKYDAAGVYQWAGRLDGLASGADEVGAIVIDGARNTYLAGSSADGSGRTLIAIAKFNAAGAFQHETLYLPAGATSTTVCAAALRGATVSVAASASGGPNGGDIVLARCGTDGGLTPPVLWDGPAHLDDIAADLEADAAGNVWIAGTTYADVSNGRAVLLRFAPDGSLTWQRRYLRSGIVDSSYLDLVVLGGTAWCTGWRSPAVNKADVLVTRYTPAGARTWVRAWDGLAHRWDYGITVCLSGTTGLYVGGGTTRRSTGMDPVVVKYRR